MTAGGFIEGNLMDAIGEPRAQLKLKLFIPVKPGDRRGPTTFHAYATTDAAGQFRSEALFPGKYLIAENAGDSPLLGEVAVEPGKTAALPAKSGKRRGAGRPHAICVGPVAALTGTEREGFEPSVGANTPTPV